MFSLLFGCLRNWASRSWKLSVVIQKRLGVLSFSSWNYSCQLFEELFNLAYLAIVTYHCFFLRLSEFVFPSFYVSKSVALLLDNFLNQLIHFDFVSIVASIDCLHVERKKLDPKGTAFRPVYVIKPFLFYSIWRQNSYLLTVNSVWKGSLCHL